MDTFHSLLQRRAIRNLLIGAVAVVVLLGVRLVVRGIEADMRATPERLPPAWQIARQQGQMAREVIPDGDVGFLVPPNQIQRIETDDYTVTRRAGPRGFPNLAPWPERADIVFLGDSMLLGEGVGVAGGFVSLIGD